MRQPPGWLVALSIAAVLTLLVACVLVFPRLLHPPLSSAELEGVANWTCPDSQNSDYLLALLVVAALCSIAS
jgi:hypothetical protein